jgi:flagellar assembly protein FliH
MQLQSDRADRKGLEHSVSLDFPYPSKSVARLEFESVEAPDAPSVQDCERVDLTATLKDEVATLENKLHQQAEVLPGKIEDARLLARLLARKDWEQELQQRLSEDRERMRKTCHDFERERTRYFAEVETQVVKLALAIAARVLHREARMDPLLLTAAVRVALEKVENESGTRLRVPLAELTMWQAEFERPEHASTLRVVGDEAMALGECVLETSVGTLDLGIEAQLGEIERGFYDLMQRRPA